MMALRHRLTLLAAATVGVTVVLVAVVAYAALRSELRGQVDESLATRFAQIDRVATRYGPIQALGARLPPPAARAGDPTGAVQYISADGEVLRSVRSDFTIPVDGDDRTVAGGASRAVLRDVDDDGLHLRVLTVAQPGGAFQFAHSLTNVDATLDRLKLVLVLLCAGGTLLAAFFGRLFGRQVIQPVSELTAAAEHITRTDDLGRRIEVRSDDEVGQMAQRFNAMLDALERSRRALDDSVHSQRQLVADASHELRTPVTSLRTNIEVLLAEGGELAADDRTRLLEDVRAETEELTALITDVIELARGDEPLQGVDDVQLDALVAEAVARARRRRPRTTFATDLEPTVVEGLSERLGRAVDNLLDNAAKHAPGRQRRRRRPARRRADRARSRPRHPGRRAPPRLRPLLPRRRGARAAGLGPRPGDRAPGGRDARRLDRRRGGAGRRRAVPAAVGAGRRATSPGRRAHARVAGDSGGV